MRLQGLFRALLLTAAVVVGNGGAFAQAYPNKVVRILVGASAGSPPDVAARAVADQLSAKYDKQFIVDNRPGANGAIAGEMVKTAAGDGYTLLFTNSSLMSISPHMIKNLPWNPLTDFAPIVKIGVSPLVFVVPKSSPHGTLGEILTASKKASGKGLNAGAMGMAMGHLSILMLNQASKSDLRVIPYNRNGDFLTDSLSGTLDISVIGIGSLLPQIKAGDVKAIAVTSAGRYEHLPGVPTVAETIPGFEAVSWFGLFGPASMGKGVISELNLAVNEVLRAPGMKTRLLDLGTEVSGGNPDDLRRSVVTDHKIFGDIIKTIKP